MIKLFKREEMSVVWKRKKRIKRFKSRGKKSNFLTWPIHVEINLIKLTLFFIRSDSYKAEW